MKLLLSETSVPLERVIGSASATIGIGLSVFAGWLVLTMLARPSSLGLPITALLATVVALAALLLTAGFRLLLPRAGGNGSLFGHTVWFSLCAVFLALAALITYVAITSGFNASFGEGLSSTLLLALLCFGAGSHFKRKHSGSSAA